MRGSTHLQGAFRSTGAGEGEFVGLRAAVRGGNLRVLSPMGASDLRVPGSRAALRAPNPAVAVLRCRSRHTLWDRSPNRQDQAPGVTSA